MALVKDKQYKGRAMAIGWMTVWMNGAEHEPVLCLVACKEGIGMK